MSAEEDLFWSTAEAGDLPEDLREIAEALGMPAARHLVETWGGSQIYIPARASVLKPWRDTRIIDEWNGRNEGELARRYGVSRRNIYDLLKQGRTSPTDPNQSDLFNRGETAA